MVDYPLLAVILTAALAQNCSQTDQLSVSERRSATLSIIIILLSKYRPSLHLSFWKPVVDDKGADRNGNRRLDVLEYY